MRVEYQPPIFDRIMEPHIKARTEGRTIKRIYLTSTEFHELGKCEHLKLFSSLWVKMGEKIGIMLGHELYLEEK